MPPPWVVKYPFGGSSVGVSIARNFGDLEGALEKVSAFSSKILVEEYIKGREATGGVIDEFRNQKHYALPVVEIIPPVKNVFLIVTAPNTVVRRGNYVRLILIWRQKRNRKPWRWRPITPSAPAIIRARILSCLKGIYILEINTLPGLTAESLLPKALNAVGSSHKELLEHLISLALKKK